MKKSVARNEKSCTFAPAFGTEEGTKRGGAGSKFFESLRPAQDRRRCEAASGRGTLTKEHQREH